MGSTDRLGVEPVGPAAGAAWEAVALEKESVMIDGEAPMAELLDADALELLAVFVEEDRVARVTGTGARVARVGAEQPVAETVTVETTVTVTKPSVPMMTVGMTTPPEEGLVVAGVITGIEAEAEVTGTVAKVWTPVEEAEEVTGTVAKVWTLVEEAVGVAELLGVLRVRI